MTLLELCEPLFQYMCRLNRLARSGSDLEMDQVRNDIKTIFEAMKAESLNIAALTGQYEKIELPLLFFVDFTIKESKLMFAYDWYELGRERNELAGDEKFFDLLDENLEDTTDAATGRLVIFYTCIGLGFTGVYTGQPESIKRLMSKISARISGMIDADEKSYICPEAYENVDARDFIEPPSTRLVGIGITLMGLIVVWSIAYFFLLKWTLDDVSNSLDTIIEHEKAAYVTESSD
ncbi:MAG: DotU family type IV/VI secretion system protein [Planctomycetes bacterium]|nr:DotU family type IV/VI secretion system protein [Planctomycetota bacterium]MBL7142741.1 DotU family type IV/VI secretion system protein [Phycisphaerae bacterium]